MTKDQHPDWTQNNISKQRDALKSKNNAMQCSEKHSRADQCNVNQCNSKQSNAIQLKAMQ